jgi:hypothetical protein
MLAVMLRDRVLAVISNEVADRFRPPGSCFRSRGLSRLRERHPVERPGPSTISPNTHLQQPISATNLTSVGMSAHAENTGLALNWELVHVSSPATVKNPVVHRCWIRPVCDGRYVIGGHTEN